MSDVFIGKPISGPEPTEEQAKEILSYAIIDPETGALSYPTSMPEDLKHILTLVADGQEEWWTWMS